MALYIVLFFSKCSFKNHLVNWIAISSFSVYLLHTHPLVMPIYLNQIRLLYNSNPLFIASVKIVGFIIVVYVIAIMLDKIRIFISRLLFSTQ